MNKRNKRVNKNKEFKLTNGHVLLMVVTAIAALGFVGTKHTSAYSAHMEAQYGISESK